jgi:hypothetical protein
MLFACEAVNRTLSSWTKVFVIPGNVDEVRSVEAAVGDLTKSANYGRSSTPLRRHRDVGLTAGSGPSLDHALRRVVGYNGRSQLVRGHGD